MRQIAVTPRLVLREMTHGDLDFIAGMLAHPEVMRFYPRCYTRDEAALWVERLIQRYARDGHGLWLVEAKDGGQPIGQVGLMVQTVEGVVEAEVGYMIHALHWNQGYATEAALGKTRLISLIRPVNLPSQKVARKLGMKREPRVVQHGGFDHWVFSMAAPNSQSTPRSAAHSTGELRSDRPADVAADSAG